MRNRAPTTEPALAPTVHEVKPCGLYLVDEVQRIFRLKKSTIRRELREGRLRVSKRAGRYFLLGRWLIEWIESGELAPRTPRATE